MLCQCTTTPDPITVTTIQDEYQIRPWQKLTPTGGQYQLRISSLIQYDCEQATIDAMLTESNGDVSVIIGDIIVPSPCQDMPSYPLSYLDLGNPAPGSYNLSIDIKDQSVIESVLNFEDRSLFIEGFENTVSIGLSDDHIFLIPEGLAWGYFDYSQAANVDVALLQSVTALDVESPFNIYNLQGDDYGYFSLENESIVQVADATPTAELYIFNGKDPARWAELQRVLEEYKTNFPEIIYSFTRWDGENISG